MDVILSPQPHAFGPRPSLSVILTVGSVTLEVTNDGFIIGTIHPPRPQIVPAGDEYVQIFKNYRRYTISIRKFQEEKV